MFGGGGGLFYNEKKFEKKNPISFTGNVYIVTRSVLGDKGKYLRYLGEPNEAAD